MSAKSALSFDAAFCVAALSEQFQAVAIIPASTSILKKSLIFIPLVVKIY